MSDLAGAPVAVRDGETQALVTQVRLTPVNTLGETEILSIFLKYAGKYLEIQWK